MKTIKLLVVLVVVGFANQVWAGSGNLKVNFASNEADFAVVEISSSKMSNFEIDVRNSYGDNLYSLKTETPRNQFKKRYDFSELEDGIYWYTVKIDNEKITKQFSVDNGEIEVLEVRKSAEPYFKQEGDMLHLTFLNYQEDDVTLLVYGKSHKPILETSLGSDFAIHKGIDLSELRFGTYDVVIADENEIYEHTVAIE